MTMFRGTVWTSLFIVLLGIPIAAPCQTTDSDQRVSVTDPGETGQVRGIAYWRQRIDAADQQIIKLLNERARHVSALIPLKEQTNSAVRDPAREGEVLAKLRSLNTGPLPDQSVARIYQAIMAEMRALQEKGR